MPGGRTSLGRMPILVCMAIEEVIISLQVTGRIRGGIGSSKGASIGRCCRLKLPSKWLSTAVIQCSKSNANLNVVSGVYLLARTPIRPSRHCSSELPIARKGRITDSVRTTVLLYTIRIKGNVYSCPRQLVFFSTIPKIMSIAVGSGGDMEKTLPRDVLQGTVCTVTKVSR